MCDIFSLGCQYGLIHVLLAMLIPSPGTIYELINLEPPFCDHMEDNNIKPLPDAYSSTLTSHVIACLNYYPERRPDVLDLLRLLKWPAPFSDPPSKYHRPTTLPIRTTYEPDDAPVKNIQGPLPLSKETLAFFDTAYDLRPRRPRPSSTTFVDLKDDRVVGFLKDPVTDVSRPVNESEWRMAYNFEMHARKCAYCTDPYSVHRNHGQLCDQGHRLAEPVARFIAYKKSNGQIYSTAKEDDKLIRVELPAGYDQVRGLLKAIERSLRHRSRNPFVSMNSPRFQQMLDPTGWSSKFSGPR